MIKPKKELKANALHVPCMQTLLPHNGFLEGCVDFELLNYTTGPQAPAALNKSVPRITPAQFLSDDEYAKTLDLIIYET